MRTAICGRDKKIPCNSANPNNNGWRSGARLLVPGGLVADSGGRYASNTECAKPSMRKSDDSPEGVDQGSHPRGKRNGIMLEAVSTEFNEKLSPKP